MLKRIGITALFESEWVLSNYWNLCSSHDGEHTESIVELVKQCTHLVSEIEEHLISRKEKDQIKAQQSLRSL